MTDVGFLLERAGHDDLAVARRALRGLSTLTERDLLEELDAASERFRRQKENERRLFRVRPIPPQ